MVPHFSTEVYYHQDNGSAEADLRVCSAKTDLCLGLQWLGEAAGCEMGILQ